MEHPINSVGWGLGPMVPFLADHSGKPNQKSSVRAADPLDVCGDCCADKAT